MNKKLVSLLSAAMLGCFGVPAWSQTMLPNGDSSITPVSAEVVPPAATTPVPCAGSLCAPVACEEPMGHFIGGAGLYFMMPYFSSNPAFIERHTFGNTAYINQTNFNQSVEAAPLVWLGYQFCNGWGVRARWFEFSSDVDADAVSPTGGAIFYVPGGAGNNVGAGDVIHANERLSVNVFDIEATNEFKCGCWSMLASAGIRYAHIAQAYQIDESTPFVSSTAPPPEMIGTTTSAHNFSGAGPTMGLEVRRVIDNSDFSFYSSCRGSILFGASHDVGEGDFFNGEVTQREVLSNGQANLIGIGELEIGGEWTHDVGRFRLMAQLALVGQIWWGPGNSTEVQSLFTMTNSTTNIHSAVPAGGNFGFLGGVGRFGIAY